jgi:ATP-dependent RNA helicase DeaD
VVAQGDEPLLLSPEPERPARPARGERPDRGDRDRGPRVARDGRPLATYRIAVGKRHKVEPRQIVGAIANEGGLSRQDFGSISIRPDFSLVELPADLPAETWDALRSTRISGKLIGLKKDDGPPPARSSSKPPGKKPRHKKG